MNINYRCLCELENQNLFESSDHRNRFSELLNCYCSYPFFNRGLCKCMYLSSWDMEHFMIMLEILNDLTLGKSPDVEPMKDNGQMLEAASEGYDKHIFRLSGAFLNNAPFEIPEEAISEEGLYIIQHALQASAVIDQIFDDNSRFLADHSIND